MVMVLLVLLLELLLVLVLLQLVLLQLVLLAPPWLSGAGRRARRAWAVGRGCRLASKPLRMVPDTASICQEDGRGGRTEEGEEGERGGGSYRCPPAPGPQEEE